MNRWCFKISRRTGVSQSTFMTHIPHLPATEVGIKAILKIGLEISCKLHEISSSYFLDKNKIKANLDCTYSKTSMNRTPKTC